MDDVQPLAAKKLSLLLHPEGAIGYIESYFAERLGLVGTPTWESLPKAFADDLQREIKQVAEYRKPRQADCGDVQDVYLQPVLGDNTVQAIALYLTPPEHSNNSYQQGFIQSPLAQWQVDVEPILLLMAEFGVYSLDDLRQQVKAKSQFLEKFRQLLLANVVNNSALQLLGAADEQAFNTRFVEQTPLASLIQMASYLLKKPQTAPFFHQNIQTNNEHKTLWLSCQQVQNALFFAAVDITSFKKSQTVLAERERFLTAMVKAIPDFLLVYDFHKQKRIFQNRDLIKHLGYNENDVEAAGNNLLSYITHSEDKVNKQKLAEIHEALNSGKAFEQTLRLQHQNGEMRYIYFRSSGLETKQGKMTSAVVIARDITKMLQAEQSLDEKQRHYQLLADNFSDLVLTTDTNLSPNFVSPSLKYLLGYEPETFIKQQDVFAVLGLKEQQQKLQKLVKQKLNSNQSQGKDFNEIIETDALAGNGKTVPVEVKISLLRDNHKVLEGLLLVVRDVSERRAFQNNQLLAAKVFENSSEGIYITNTEGVITQVNDAFQKITGFEPEQVIGKKPSWLNAGWQENGFRDTIFPAIEKQGFWSGEVMSRRASGEAYLTLIRISEVKNAQGKLLGLITSFKDITEAKSSEENIKKLAYYDPLTRLPNRLLFKDRFSQSIQRAMRNREYVAGLFLDLDGFKAVNDDHGHALGDRLLKAVAKRLTDNVRGDDTVARLGGDEFTVVLQALPSKEKAESAASQIASKLIHVLNQPFQIQGKTINIGASIGVAIYPDDGNNIDALLKSADTAMYHAKNAGKNHYQFFTEDMHKRAAKRQALEKRLLQAIDNDEFILAFQPKITPHTSRLLGFEALLRWRRKEDNTLLTPNTFLRAFDDLGLGHIVGEKTIMLACEKIKSLQKQGLKSCSVAVNIFPRHYRDNRFVRSIAKALKQTGVRPEYLSLEISEDMLMDDLGMSFSILSQLKSLGVKIAVDGFATEAIALQSLRRLPIDEVKIDKNMLLDLEQNKEQQTFLTALVHFAKALGLRVTVTGIERESQLDIIQSWPCDSVQGFYFAKPMTDLALGGYIRQQLEAN